MNLRRFICTIAIAAVCILAIQTSMASTKTPDGALDAMKQGNARFASGHPTHPNSGHERIDETATGQNPFVTLITCSDSRVPVERVFDQGIGDVFVIRVAGNVCDTDEIGSIEYGVDHLGTPLLVVLGHVGCGAVTAVATHAELHGSIPALVDNIAPAVARAERNTGLSGSAVVPAAVEENVWQSISDLLSGSPGTVKLVDGHQLKIVGAVYDITDGTVKWLGEHPGQASLLAAGSPSHSGGHGDTASESSGHGATDSGHGDGANGGHGEEDEEGHGEEGAEGHDDDSEMKALLGYTMQKVNTMLMFLVIGMCILALGLALLAFQNMKLKMPAVKLPKKKKPKDAGKEPGENAEDGDATGDSVSVD